MAPLLWSLLALAFDVANFVRPTPNLFASIERVIDSLVNAKQVAPARWVEVTAVAAAPGLALMALLVSAFRRIWRTSPLFANGAVSGRAPDRTVLAEERLANVVEEMAIAAGIPPPRVLIVAGGANAAAFGCDDRHVTLLVGEALPAALRREELEGLTAHLVASIADGDMAIGLRVTTTLALFGLLARISGSFTDRGAFRQTVELWRAVIAPTSTNTIALLGTLADPFGGAHEHRQASEASGDLTLRDWLMMPLVGPLVFSGFLVGMVSEFLLEPLIALAWRQRKYMADATAVQLTRDPDALAGALRAIAGAPVGIASWTAHLAVAADPRAGDGPFGASIVPIFPSLARRERALVRMGAHADLELRPRVPLALAIVGIALLVVLGAMMAVVVYLLAIVSTAFSGLFTLAPAAVLHVLLRWLAR